MNIVSVIGIDPGPTTGMCFLDYDYNSPLLMTPKLVQVNYQAAADVLYAMLFSHNHDTAMEKYAQIEKFVTTRGAGSRGEAADITRELIPVLENVFKYFGYHISIRPAADIKRWATDKRLEKAGIISKNKTSMRHSFDGGRHALYCAVKDAHRKDPLA